MSSPEELSVRRWGMLCHLSGLLLFVGIPFGHLLGPLVVWLLKKNEFPFVDEQGKEAMNFQISMTIYMLLPVLLSFVLIGIPFVFLLLAANFVLVIIAAVKASDGEPVRYPATLRFLK